MGASRVEGGIDSYQRRETLLPLRIPESGHRLATLPNGPRIIEASVELQSLLVANSQLCCNRP
jgi:hypothetical protein